MLAGDPYRPGAPEIQANQAATKKWLVRACQKTPVLLESGMPNCRRAALSWLPITEGRRFSNLVS
jgi:hypothetical protein